MNNQSNKDNKRHGVEEVVPVLAYEKLISCSRSYLVDVRTRAEWSFVGTPVCQSMKNEVIFCEWASFPDMVKKSEFLEEKIHFQPLFATCKSGKEIFLSKNFFPFRQALRGTRCNLAHDFKCFHDD